MAITSKPRMCSDIQTEEARDLDSPVGPGLSVAKKAISKPLNACIRQAGHSGLPNLPIQANMRLALHRFLIF
jgi:hypothetical protein